MTTELQIVRQRGGFRKPISVREFIRGHLLIVDEDYIAEMHRAYKSALIQAAVTRGRKYAYHAPTYHSFNMMVQQMAREGLLEFTGREEESDSPQFINWPVKPLRRYYRLAAGAMVLRGREDGHRLASETRRNTDGTGTP